LIRIEVVSSAAEEGRDHDRPWRNLANFPPAVFLAAKNSENSGPIGRGKPPAEQAQSAAMRAERVAQKREGVDAAAKKADSSVNDPVIG
jgi:hypothetical protein